MLVLLDTNAYLRLAKRVKPMLGVKFGQVREAVVVTDDLRMHHLAEEFEISVWHGYELPHKMRAAKMIDSEKSGKFIRQWRRTATCHKHGRMRGKRC